MITKVSKKEVFLMSAFSGEAVLFFIFSTGFLAFIYFTDLDGNAKDIFPLAIGFGVMLLIWIIVLYFYTLSMLNKIFAIIQNEGFIITHIDLNAPPKIMIKKNEEEFFLALTSISIRGTYIIVDQKYNKDSSTVIEKKTLYTRFDSIKKLNSILKEITE